MASFSGIYHGGYGDFETSGTLNGGGICFEWANAFTELGKGIIKNFINFIWSYFVCILIIFPFFYI